MKTMEQFYDEIIESEELSDKLASASDEQKLEEFLKENEVDCTTRQFNGFFLAKAKESGELTDEDIEQVAGGMQDWSDDWRNDYYIRNHNERGMIMYIANLAYSDQKLYEPKTNTTFTITVVSRQSPGEFELIDVEGKRMTRTHTAYTLYTKIKKHDYLLPWER